LPTTDEEVWRYSRIDELELEQFAPALPAPATPVPAGAQAVLDALGTVAGAVVLANGYVVHQHLEPRWRDAGVTLIAATDAASADGSEAEAALDAFDEGPVDWFADLNDAWNPAPVIVSVPRGVDVDEPIVVIDWIDEPDVAVFPHLVVRVGEQASVAVLDWHGSDDVVAFAGPVIDLAAETGGRVRYLNVQDRGPRVWQIASQVSRADRDATVTATQAALGGDYARTRADCRLAGRGASGELSALYFGEGEQMLDFRTFQDHAAPDTTSNLLFKGAVGDHSKSVYTGLIKVRKDARGTNAFQTNRNIKLSDHAWAESVPNLEIENNDVRCSHASTVGPVDEEQRFYLESRGVPTAVAERLIVGGFFAEVLELLPVPAAIPLITSRINDRLDRRLAIEFGSDAAKAAIATAERAAHVAEAQAAAAAIERTGTD
jgi:Fe-S cluster assembly protein SufD